MSVAAYFLRTAILRQRSYATSTCLAQLWPQVHIGEQKTHGGGHQKARRGAYLASASVLWHERVYLRTLPTTEVQ
uniref:Uncharacterized protein n=1 Tax=Hyaloperonospora arabidopsidis (strain Emoy2) TaxID=559515 RepID=M4BMS7_HYAAE